MDKSVEREVLSIVGEIKQAIRETGKRVSGLYDRLAKAYEGELKPDGSMETETAHTFLDQHAQAQGAIGDLRKAYEHVEAAERAINGQGGE